MNLVTSILFNKKFYGHYRVLCFSEPVGQKGSNIVPVTTRIVQACRTERFTQVTLPPHTNPHTLTRKINSHAQKQTTCDIKGHKRRIYDHTIRHF
jgi:hypothetical protein